MYRTDAIAMRGSDGVTLDAGGVLSHVEGLQAGWLTGNNPLTSGVITCVMIHIYDAAATDKSWPYAMVLGRIPKRGQRRDFVRY